MTAPAACLPRIIPADAGSTNRFPTHDCRRPDHPRGCGEHQNTPSGRNALMGSSPRMRGALTRIFLTDCTRPGSWKDHPRGCGEHLKVSADGVPRAGSSPRMRGAPSRQQHEPRIVRIIPADAGSTTIKAINAVNIKDHPRGCGEHCGFENVDMTLLGSSPRMRGALRYLCGLAIRIRIIPADAGSTEKHVVAPYEIGDHPRGCGEHGAGSLMPLSP